VQAAIRRASGSRSVIFTTHKVSQARAADRIIVMSHGRIVELGTHDELLWANGAYAQLLRAGDSVSEAEASTVVDLALRD
jgi:ABC-type multidrug transport system fused ATPase/permease subunit